MSLKEVHGLVGKIDSCPNIRDECGWRLPELPGLLGDRFKLCPLPPTRILLTPGRDKGRQGHGAAGTQGSRDTGQWPLAAARRVLESTQVRRKKSLGTTSV